MAIIIADSALIKNPKFYELMSELNIGKRDLYWMLHHLWYWVAEFYPDGNLKGVSEASLAHVMEFNREPKALAQALQKTGFLDSIENGFRIHDWDAWRSDATRLKARRMSDKRPTNVRQTSKRTESLSLSLPVSKGTTETKTTTKAVSDVVKPKAVHVEFVDRFKEFYEAVVKRPFKYGRAQFVIADKLIKAYGNDTVIEKAKILAVMCKRQSTWFTKGGYADFSIEKLSSQWNGIIAEAVPATEDEEAEAIRKKWRDHNELVTRIMATR